MCLLPGQLRETIEINFYGCCSLMRARARAYVYDVDALNLLNHEETGNAIVIEYLVNIMILRRYDAVLTMLMYRSKIFLCAIFFDVCIHA